MALQILSPDGKFTVAFTPGGDILRFFETLPDGGAVDYFHRPAGNRAPLMHPWCNRVEAGVFAFAGKTHLLRPLHGGENNALHGNWLRPWTVELRAHDAIFSMACKAENGPSRATPYEYDVRQAMTLDDKGLSFDITLTNRGETLPFGLGLHPFFPRPQDTVVQMAVSRMENCRADMIPEAQNPFASVPAHWSFNDGFNISDRNLSPAARGFGHADLMDNCFTGIDPAEGAVITWPGYGRQLHMTASGNCVFGVCYVPAARNGAANDFFCLELATNGVNMQNRMAHDAGATILAAGESMSVRTRLDIFTL